MNQQVREQGCVGRICVQPRMGSGRQHIPRDVCNAQRQYFRDPLMQLDLEIILRVLAYFGVHGSHCGHEHLVLPVCILFAESQ
jgi:hypothetical protein